MGLGTLRRYYDRRDLAPEPVREPADFRSAFVDAQRAIMRLEDENAALRAQLEAQAAPPADEASEPQAETVRASRKR